MFCLIFLLGHIVLVTELMAGLCRRRILGVEETDMKKSLTVMIGIAIKRSIL